jgi:MYXO-CTERM domain-containing protein
VTFEFPTATELTSGKVLVFGGGPAAYLYDPTAGSWSSGGSLNQQRRWHAAVLLPNGKVLAIGGQKAGGSAFTNTAELYDPAQNTWSYTGSMVEIRMQVAAALLPTNRVVVPGGWTGGNLTTKNVEIYDPATGLWTTTSPMNEFRRMHSFTPLPGGKFLAAGGLDYNDNEVASAEVLGLLANGESCASAVECSSVLCVDGVCCNNACAGPCEACTSAKKGGGQDGVCGPIGAGQDPDSECADEGIASCGKTGVCDGSGTCQLYASGSTCFGPVCAAGVLTKGTCTGSGTCVQSPTNCAPYVCATGTTCGTTCTTDADCELGAWCNASTGTCQQDQANGAACTSASQCTSGHCVDGVCCDSPCGGVCQACAAALKQSGAGDGVCGFAAKGTDPHATCPDDGVASCQRDGSCDGAGACALYAAGTACGATSCLGNVQSGFACDGTGTCNPASSVDCGTYLCVTDKCASSCTSDGDCVDTAWCDSSTCVAKGKNGETCQSGAACLSGACADGVCCDSECSGQCEACDVSGAEGTCVPVSGAPKNGRPSCAAATAGEPCSERACDGITRESCAGWVGATIECRDVGCSDGVAIKAAACDGMGACPAAKTQECEPYACGGDDCTTSCTSDADCAPGALCDTSTQQCARADLCADDQTVKHADGTESDCSPYLCKGGACRKTCTSIADCIVPYVCDSDSRCSLKPGSSEGSDSGGCGCRTESRAPGSMGAWALLSLLALARRRRRQRNS